MGGTRWLLCGSEAEGFLPSLWKIADTLGHRRILLWVTLPHHHVFDTWGTSSLPSKNEKLFLIDLDKTSGMRGTSQRERKGSRMTHSLLQPQKYFPILTLGTEGSASPPQDHLPSLPSGLIWNHPEMPPPQNLCQEEEGSRQPLPRTPWNTSLHLFQVCRVDLNRGAWCVMLLTRGKNWN